MTREPSTAQAVVLKMDDLGAGWWREWKRLADLCVEMDVAAGFGIFCASLEEGNADYDAWIRSIIADPRFELWCHGWTGNGPADEPGMEFKGTPYEYQKAAFVRSREALGLRLGLKLRTYSEHWHGGDATTARCVAEEPDLRVWMCWGWKDRDLRRRVVQPDRLILDDLSVTIECADPANWTPGYVNFDEFRKGFAGHEADPVLVLQGHPWSWTDTSSKPDRTGAVLDRWEEFRKIVAFLQERGCRFTTPYGWSREVRGLTPSDPD